MLATTRQRVRGCGASWLLVALGLLAACGDSGEAKDAWSPPDATRGTQSDIDARGPAALPVDSLDASLDAVGIDPGMRGSDADVGAGPQPFGNCGFDVDIDAYTATGSEFIFDVATTMANEPACVIACTWVDPIGGVDVERFPWLERTQGCSAFTCTSKQEYLAHIFERSDTALTMLHGIAYAVGKDGTAGLAVLSSEDQRAFVDDINTQLGARRVLMAPSVMPNDRIDVQLARMQRLAAEGGVSAWHTVTAWGPGRLPLPSGYWLDQDVGPVMIQKGIDLGVPIFLVHKGMPYPELSPTYTNPIDVGPAAARFPEATFVILHAAFEHGLGPGEQSDPDGSDHGWGAQFGVWPEGPYDEVLEGHDVQDDAGMRDDDNPADSQADDNDAGAPPDEGIVDVEVRYPLDRGVNSLIRSMRAAGIGPNQNVYASLDVVWAHLITRPIEAAHVLGKLLRHVGEDNILWGTSSVFYGGPVPQIEAFRDFQIPPQMRAAYGYPELTPERKAKILGLNAARLFCINPATPH